MATLRTYWQQVSSNWFSINWGIQVEPYPVVNISVCEAFIPWYLESRPDVEKIIPLVYNSTMFV